MKKGVNTQRVVASRTKWTFWIVLIILALLILLYIQFSLNSKIGLGLVLNSPLTGRPAAGGEDGGDDSAGLGGDSGGELGGSGGDAPVGGEESSEFSADSVGGSGGGSFRKDPTPRVYACSNDQDDDGDGWSDKDDAGCYDDEGNYVSSRDSENLGEKEDQYECSDGTDNDSDTYADSADTSCSSGRDDTESSQCNDLGNNGEKIDNDGDEVANEDDPGCWTNPEEPGSYNPNINNEAIYTTQCQDGIDNDGDYNREEGTGGIDYLGGPNGEPKDPNCESKGDNDEQSGGGGSDRDSDGIPDSIDNCPDIYNPDQKDEDPQNGIGDVCEVNKDPEKKEEPRDPRQLGDREREETQQSPENREQDKPFVYGIKGGDENLIEGEFARIVVTEKDSIQFKIDSRNYIIEVIEIVENKVTLKIKTPNGEITKTINVNSLERIDLGAGKVIAMHVSAILDNEFTEITVALLGDVEEGSGGAPLESIFEEVTQNEGNRVDARQITEIGDSIREVPTIVKTTVLIIAIVILIIYVVSRSLATRKMKMSKAKMPSNSKLPMIKKKR